jgi:hypothetical protein
MCEDTLHKGENDDDDDNNNNNNNNNTCVDGIRALFIKIVSFSFTEIFVYNL